MPKDWGWESKERQILRARKHGEVKSHNNLQVVGPKWREVANQSSHFRKLTGFAKMPSGAQTATARKPGPRVTKRSIRWETPVERHPFRGLPETGRRR